MTGLEAIGIGSDEVGRTSVFFISGVPFEKLGFAYFESPRMRRTASSIILRRGYRKSTPARNTLPELPCSGLLLWLPSLSPLLFLAFLANPFTTGRTPSPPTASNHQSTASAIPESDRLHPASAPAQDRQHPNSALSRCSASTARPSRPNRRHQIDARSIPADRHQLLANPAIGPHTSMCSTFPSKFVVNLATPTRASSLLCLLIHICPR
jgi:hypothetical protein